MERAKCRLCGEPMPEGEEMFKFHGYSGNCPKPPLPKLLQDTAFDVDEWYRRYHRYPFGSQVRAPLEIYDVIAAYKEHFGKAQGGGLLEGS
ncbi:MAG: hypothetical protein JWQ87_2037 [Candidatus Sulfotelmatobacter sp.]|nr:hypothetical protein [Candidatus Sulfotelmatobacter sp.]